MFKYFKTGIQTGIRHWKIAGIVYFFQLVLAATLGIQVYHVLEASIGQSLELNKLLGSYDHTVINDLINVHGASISPLIGQLRWLVVSYLLFSVFINAGILFAVVRDRNSWLTFCQGGATYFLKFGIVGIVFLVITALISALIWIPFLGFFMVSPEYVSSEKISLILLLLVLLLYAFVLAFIFGASLFTRLGILRVQMNGLAAVLAGFRLAGRNYLSVLWLSLLFVMAQLLLILTYWFLYDSELVSVIMLILFVVLQQVMAYLRVMIRISVYSGFDHLYADIHQEPAAA